MNDAGNEKQVALAKYLEVEPGDIGDVSWDDDMFTHGSGEYLVLTDDEADDRCTESIKSSLWAFNVDFLSRYTNALDAKHARDAFGKMLGQMCESAQPIVQGLLGPNLDRAIEDAMDEDGRGHFLAGYDGDENEVESEGVTYYIYRVG